MSREQKIDWAKQGETPKAEPPKETPQSNIEKGKLTQQKYENEARKAAIKQYNTEDLEVFGKPE
jgi:hypothetical protein